MINISIAASVVLPDGVPETAFTLELGGGFTPPADMVRNGDPLRLGSGWTPNVRVGETLSFDDALFQSIVTNYTAGGSSTTFLARVLFYVSQGTLEVRQDAGSPMTTKEIVTYTAP